MTAEPQAQKDDDAGFCAGAPGRAGTAPDLSESMSRPLSRRYALIIASCTLPLLLLVAGLMWVQYDSQRRQQIDLFAAEVAAGGLVVDGVVKQALDHIAQLREQAEDLLSGRVPSHGGSIEKLLTASTGPGKPISDGKTLDGIARTPLQARLGNIFVGEGRLARAHPGEAEMALALFEPMRLKHRMTPYLRWSYYFSASSAFITMYPFVSRADLVEGHGHASLGGLVDAYLTYDVHLDATPARNPQEKSYWSPPYLDAAGAGWMVSHAVPVTSDGQFVGTVGTDLLLSFLDETLRSFPLQAGRLWIVSAEGELIADRDAGAHAEEPRRLGAVFAASEGKLGELLVPGRRNLDGYHVLAAPVPGTPWTLLHAVSEAELGAIALARLAPYAIVLVGILLTILATHWLLRGQFVRPAIGLARHLESESRNGGGHRRPVAPLWRPWYGMVSDVFARNRATMTKLTESEARYRSVVEAQTEFVMRMSPDGYISVVNEAYARYVGMTREQLLDPNWCDFDQLPPDERERFVAHLARLTPENPVATIELRNDDNGGDPVWCVWTDRGIFDEEGKLVEVQSVGRDVTERVLAERARQETERLRETALEAALDGYVSIDHEGRIIELNAAAEAIFGYARADAVGQPIAELMVPASHREAHRAGFARHLADGSARMLGRRVEVPAQRADGSVFPIEIVIQRAMRGEHPIFIAYLRDLTEQKRAAAALAESEAQFRAIAEGVPLPIVISSIERPHVHFVNERARSTLGLEAGDTGTVAIAAWQDPAQRIELARLLLRDGVVDAFPARMKAADGRVFEALISARRVEHDGTPAVLAAVTDITRQKQAEAELARHREALHQTEKLSALGSLLAGVAHELNNPLSVVIGYSSMLKEMAPDAPTIMRAEKIHAAAERCSRIVRTFLAMARKKPPTREAVDINETVRAALEIAGYGLRSAGVEVRTELAPDLPPVWGDGDQLHQVLTNLVVNAQQALLLVPAPRRLTIVTAETDGAVEILVADNGPGMDEAVKARIFEPFYTTKPAGVGTGVGLSVCDAIVGAHEGRIAVDSTPGSGARFTVTLPSGGRTATTPNGGGAPAAEKSNGHARILVVDDEPDISAMIAELLRQAGHAVSIARDAVDALAQVRRGGIELVVSDIRMPGLDGPGLYRALGDAGHDLTARVIFITGDTLAPEIAQFISETGAPVIEKPLDPQILRRSVGERLAAIRGDTA